jgi:hypothetical protein
LPVEGCEKRENCFATTAAFNGLFNFKKKTTMKTLNELTKEQLIEITKKIYLEYRINTIDFDTVFDSENSSNKTNLLTSLTREILEVGLDEMILQEMMLDHIL